MPNFKDLGTKIVSGIGSSVPGPLGDLFRSKHGRNSVSFPSDVEGVGQRHFIRFNVVTKTGTSFGQMVNGGKLPKLMDAADGAVNLGARIAGTVGSAVNASVHLRNLGIPESLIPPSLPSLPSVPSLPSLPSVPKLPGIPTSLESTLGQLSDQSSKFKDSVVESVPTAKDALGGLGSFAGSIGGVAQEFSKALQGTVKSEGDIVLYMPVNITETYQADWSGGEMGLLGAVGGLAAQVMSGDVAGILQDLNSSAALTGAAGIATEAIGGIAGNKLASIGAGLGINKTGGENLQAKGLKEQGLAINPYWELFFTGVQPRTFTFDFKMSPKNSTEGESIQQIVQMFKTYAAPPATVDGSRRYWGYPSMFQIEYWNTEKLHKLKTCALTNIVVNYSGDGTNHTFYDGRPMQTNLTLTFMESELLTRQDMEAGY